MRRRRLVVVVDLVVASLDVGGLSLVLLVDLPLKIVIDLNDGLLVDGRRHTLGPTNRRKGRCWLQVVRLEVARSLTLARAGGRDWGKQRGRAQAWPCSRLWFSLGLERGGVLESDEDDRN